MTSERVETLISERPKGSNRALRNQAITGVVQGGSEGTLR